MPKGIFLLVLITLVTSIKSFAQHTISGKTLTVKNTPALNISVKLTDALNQPVYTTSDSIGMYRFVNLKTGHYTLIFSGLNFETINKALFLRIDTVLDVELKEQITSLAEVTVNNRPILMERKTDRIIFNVENSIAASGGDALELLSKIPGLRVLNDQVSLVGKGSVNIMVNDKPVPLSADDLSNYLKSLSAADIAKIEVISNPSASYDAQGNNGLINILFRKPSSDGFKGSLNSVITRASYLTAATGGMLNYKGGDFTVSSNANFRKGSVVPLEESNVFYPQKSRQIINKDRNFRTVPSGQVSVGYQPSAKTLLSLTYSGGLTRFHSEEHIRTTDFNTTQNVDSTLQSDANATIRSAFQSVNMYLKNTLSAAGGTVTFNADWFRYNDDKNRFFNSVSYDNNGETISGSLAEFLSSATQQLNLYTLKTDVELPLKVFTFSMGAKASFINNNSALGFYKRDEGVYGLVSSQSDLFRYKENTQSLYFNLNKTVGRWDFQAGLRGEYTQLTGIAVSGIQTNNYLQLFPTLYIVFKKNEANSWNFNYGRRINRPPYRKLNPFRWYSNPFAYSEGNPFLQPSFQDNLELVHTYRNQLTTTLSFSRSTNGFADVNLVEAGSDLQISRPLNFLKTYNYQFSQSAVFQPNRCWSSTNQYHVFYTVSHSSAAETLPRLNGFGAYLATINQLTFNKSKTFSGEVSFWYQLPFVEGFNRNSSQCNLDIALKLLLDKKKLQIAVGVNDMLKTNIYRYESMVNNISQQYRNYYDSRSLRISARYSFGNEKVKLTDRKTGNEEERNRN